MVETPLVSTTSFWLPRSRGYQNKLKASSVEPKSKQGSGIQEQRLPRRSIYLYGTQQSACKRSPTFAESVGILLRILLNPQCAGDSFRDPLQKLAPRNSEWLAVESQPKPVNRPTKIQRKYYRSYFWWELSLTFIYPVGCPQIPRG